MKFSAKTAAILLLFLGLIFINYLASSLPIRIDATADHLYTLSSGTKAVLRKIEDPITLNLYYSKDSSGVPIAYKNYASRVEEMLREYVRASRGKIVMNIINPQPDTPQEDQATAAGLTPEVSSQGGDRFFFGLVVIQADQQKTIPSFNPEREPFLEYDLSKIIYSVQQFDKPKLGLLTSLPLQGSSPQDMQMMMMMHQQPKPPQFIMDELKDTFAIVTVDPTAKTLPDGLDVLAVIHPERLSPQLQFAIDQFLLGGKPVFLAVDPSSEYFKAQGGQQAMFGGPQPNISSDLPVLLNAYGIQYDPSKVVGDLVNATQVQTGIGTISRYPIWITVHQKDFDRKAMPTAQLHSAMFVEPGCIAQKPGSTLTFTPLVQTSSQAGLIDAAMLRFEQPDDIAKQITPSGKKTLAALITGKFHTAFPNGAPSDESAGKTADKNKPARVGNTAPALKESKTTSTLFVVADTDWLFDHYSVQTFQFFGQTAARPFNDNLALAANTADYLGGSQDLISIRGKGTSIREFDVIQNMQVAAQKKYEDQLTDLDAQLQKVQSKLSDLQTQKTAGNRLVATPELARAIRDYQKQAAQMRGQRREIRRALRVDIDRLENELLVVNLLTSPVLVGLFGFWFYRRRRN